MFYCILIFIYLYIFRSIRVQIHSDALFVRNIEEPEETNRVIGHFYTKPQDIDGVHDFDFDELTTQLMDSVENFNSRGSGFMMESIRTFTVCVTVFRPLAASSYIPTPTKLTRKQAVVNVKM